MGEKRVLRALIIHTIWLYIPHSFENVFMTCFRFRTRLSGAFIGLFGAATKIQQDSVAIKQLVLGIFHYIICPIQRTIQMSNRVFTFPFPMRKNA